ncbi:MAG: hypothetical protein R3E95_20150 [Thiolinea sp.]
MVYAFLCSLSLDTRAEESTSKGRVDIALRFTLPDGQQRLHLGVQDGGQGRRRWQRLAADQGKGLAAPYRDGQQRIFLIGMEFNQQAKNLVRFEWEELLLNVTIQPLPGKPLI